MANTKGRLTKELAEVGKDDTSGVKAKPVEPGNLRHLTGTINGPSGSPYDGGVFVVDIQIPKNYPFEPPKMKFTTKIWHPNVSSQTGAICLVRLPCLTMVFFVVDRVNVVPFHVIAFLTARLLFLHPLLVRHILSIFFNIICA